jgi:demethylmenaquinone methyltransferase/2-methoxy-6-polyprenyl-1,4-benzoquinol methylase
MIDERTAHARALFKGIAPAYGTPAEILSFGQYGRWRRALVRSLHLSARDQVLDVATGTGLIARDIEKRYGCHVVGVDQSTEMMGRAEGLSDRVGADANVLPFHDSHFAGLVFSYLFRYVADPAVTLRELVRVVKPGGVIASVEFGVPPSSLPRIGWNVHALGVFPLATRAFGSEWAHVGAFLPHSIVEWANEWPLERQVDMWQAAGIREISMRRMTFGTGVLIKGRKRGD